MKGNIAVFLRIFKNLFLLSIFCRLVDFFDYLSYSSIDLFVREYLFCRIDEKDVCAAAVEARLLFSPAFSDPSLEQIAFNSTFEHLLGHRYHYSVVVATVFIEVDTAQACHVSMTTLGK